LVKLFTDEGVERVVEGNTPLFIDHENSVWYIAEGSVDLFAVSLDRQGNLTDRRRYLFSMGAGSLLFGLSDFGTSEKRNTLLLSSSMPARLFEMDRKTFQQKALAHTEERPFLIKAMEEWVSVWSESLALAHPPSDFQVLVPQADVRQEAKQDTTWRSLHPVWVALRSGTLCWLGEYALPTGEPDRPLYFPVCSCTWLKAKADCVVEVLDTSSWFQNDGEWRGLYAFHRVLAVRLAAVLEREREQEKKSLTSRTVHDEQLMDTALRRLLAVTEDSPSQTVEVDSNDALFKACHLIGQHMGITMKPVRRERKSGVVTDRVQDIAQTSGIRARKVVLKDDWWRQDNGPLLAFREETGEPVALLPGTPTTYRYHCPATGESGTLTEKEAEKLQPFAYMFYRTLPPRPLGILDILRFGMHRSVRRDFIVLGAFGALAGALGMAIPIATGLLYDTIIPEAYRNSLVQMSLILTAATLSIAMFQLVSGLAMLRMEGRMDTSIQAAIWDRLLNLPVTFFRNFTAGDLALRANTINSIRQLFSGAVLSSLLSGIFSSFNFFLLFRYDVGLALLAGILVFIAMLVTGGLGVWQIRLQRKLLDMQGRISGTVLQLFNGISKFRMAAAERRAFFLWAKMFGEQKKLSFKARLVENYLAVFQSFFPLVTTMIIFYLVAASRQSMSAGDFTAFMSAFNTFLAAMLSLATSVVSLVQIVPMFERAKPILQVVPENHTLLDDPGEIRGHIEVKHVTFRYHPDQPYVLNDVSITIKPGQFVAFVGASGSGKSTLMRLLMGFEQPESGSIYYDGKDLRHLDVHLLRQQFGVVLQNSKIMSGDIYTNIVGSAPLTHEEAWEAAAMAGLDEDIRAMPMGMHTIVSEGGGTLSGGQRQRLMIARAIARRPKILFFDEATSALDNRTQAIVSASLERLQATRIVIAHRLSTIVNADWIYVFDKGKIVQQGTYQDLISQPGPFQEQARRQLA
jgi:NHLM bacteriocin system ABC transporter ATP-binding protein